MKNVLKPNESPVDRIDILCRVFKMKLNMLLDDNFKKHVFGFAIGKLCH